MAKVHYAVIIQQLILINKGHTMKAWSALFIAVLMMAPVVQANAQNYPCSKSMGGVSHCKDGKFVCKNGKISQSKKICTK